jgi:hypothetical protein
LEWHEEDFSGEVFFSLSSCQYKERNMWNLIMLALKGLYMIWVHPLILCLNIVYDSLSLELSIKLVL